MIFAIRPVLNRKLNVLAKCVIKGYRKQTQKLSGTGDLYTREYGVLYKNITDRENAGDSDLFWIYRLES